MIGIPIFSLVWFFVLMLFVMSIVKKIDTKGGSQGQQRPTPQQQQYRPMQQQPMQQTQYRQVPPQQQQMQQTGRRTMTDADRARLEEYRRKQAQSQGAYVPSKPTEPNQNLDANRRRNAEQPDIVERAKANSKRYASQDETLDEMESGHGHSERVSSAVAGYVESEREAHRKLHEEPRPSIEEESCLGTIEDLMVKGYDGNLSFERDFIGEAQDFLASITMPG